MPFEIDDELTGTGRGTNGIYLYPSVVTVFMLSIGYELSAIAVQAA